MEDILYALCRKAMLLESVIRKKREASYIVLDWDSGMGLLTDIMRLISAVFLIPVFLF